MSIFNFASDLPGHMLAVAALLAAICSGFILRFVLPALSLGRRFQQTIRQLEKLRESLRAEGKSPDPQRIGQDIMAGSPLEHLWREFAQTLHPTRGTDGQARWRATALAETFLTEQALVDTPLRAEFYKHLPGILTGIGILGTFSGLIVGLTHFEVSASADVVRGSLKELIQGVGHAFKISALAIGLAMLLTWIEKSLVVARYRQVERLNQLIDSLFDTGIGEEYLARLVHAGEASAQQAAQLRQALVQEMQQALATMVAQQQEASQRQLANLGAGLSEAVAAAMGQPMERMAQALERLETRQGSTLSSGISEAMGGLLQNLQGQWQSRLGEQQARDEARQAQLMQALQQTAQRFEESTRRLESTLQETTAALTERLGQQVGSVVTQLQQGQHSQQNRLTEQTDLLVGKLASHLQGITGELRQAAATLDQCVARFAETGQGTVSQLTAGAASVQAACQQFAQAGNDFQSAARSVQGAGQQIGEAAQALATSGAESRQVFAEQQQASRQLKELLQEVQGTLALAQREASLNVEVVSRLEGAARALGQAERRAETYLQGVSEVLAKAHGSFTEHLAHSLQEGNRQFQQELAEAVDTLKDAIEHLGDVLATESR